jgi:phage FluMu protein Com
MVEVRCKNCNKLLYKVSDIPYMEGELLLEIKCDRCKEINKNNLEELELNTK